jgi:hypothetical protein
VTGDPFAEWDAAYVLGALSPADRRTYEGHLAHCHDCADAVADLAAVPGLLSRAPAAAVLDSGTRLEPPPDLLPRLLLAARRERRRRSVWTVAAIGIAAALVAVGALVGVQQVGSPDVGTPVALTAVRDVPVEATLRMESVAWGTKLHLHCTYDGSAPAGDGYQRPVYQLVAVPADGGAPRQVAQWTVVPGLDAAIEGSTDLATHDIAEVRLQTPDGTVLMRASPQA